MNIIDIICGVFLLASIAHGWRKGFISIVGNLLSLIVGFVLTTQLVSWISASPNIFGEWIKNWHLNNPLTSIGIFLFLFWIVVKLLRILVRMLDSLWSMISFIPLIGKVNNLLGAIVGLIAGAFTLLVLVYVTKNFVIGTLWHITSTDVWGQRLLTSTTYIKGDTILTIAKSVTPNLVIWK